MIEDGEFKDGQGPSDR